jgi:hypothetical protein
MGKRGFSATTFVLVAVLVGALFMVGRTVIPPPPGPPEPPKRPEGMSQEVVSKQNAENAAKQTEMMKKKMMEHMKATKYKRPASELQGKKKFDPSQIEITSQWTHDRVMGDAGNKQMEIMVAKAKAAQKTLVPVPALPNGGKVTPMAP